MRPRLGAATLALQIALALLQSHTASSLLIATADPFDPTLLLTSSPSAFSELLSASSTPLATKLSTRRATEGHTSTPAPHDPAPPKPSKSSLTSSELHTSSDTQTSSDFQMSPDPQTSSDPHTSSDRHTSSNPQASSSPTKPNVGAIAGGAVGGTAGVALLVSAPWLWLRRRRRRADSSRAGYSRADDLRVAGSQPGLRQRPVESKPGAEITAASSEPIVKLYDPDDPSTFPDALDPPVVEYKRSGTPTEGYKPAGSGYTGAAEL